MWSRGDRSKTFETTSLAKTSQLDATVYVLHDKVAVAAANLSMPEGETLHYRLTMSVMPPNIDVWSWVKWFRNSTLVPKPAKTLTDVKPTQAKEPTTTQTPPTQPEPDHRDLVPQDKPVFDQKHLLR